MIEELIRDLEHLKYAEKKHNELVSFMQSIGCDKLPNGSLGRDCVELAIEIIKEYLDLE